MSKAEVHRVRRVKMRCVSVCACLLKPRWRWSRRGRRRGRVPEGVEGTR